MEHGLEYIMFYDTFGRQFCSPAGSRQAARSAHICETGLLHRTQITLQTHQKHPFHSSSSQSQASCGIWFWWLIWVLSSWFTVLTLKQLGHFYTPVWKTGRIMPWQCPSVRPRFPDFSSTCFEISIWNLVYAFSRWHDMSSLSCITIGSIWPSLQPKVGQTYFLQSWPHESR